jgi:rSAM/selenodomain-associated transferase 1
MTPRCAVIVFAKAPVAGTVKTRLAGALGAAGAARLAARMLESTTACALEAALGPVEVCCAPDASHPAFTALARSTPPVALTAQGDGDLGRRMQRAFERALASQARAIVIGTDAPALDAAYLRDAATALLAHDAVIGPAVDGGYALIGLRRPAAALFDGVEWSTPRVLAQTRERLGRLGWRWAELAPLHDIDEPADLRHLPAGWVPLALQE